MACLLWVDRAEGPGRGGAGWGQPRAAQDALGSPRCVVFVTYVPVRLRAVGDLAGLGSVSIPTLGLAQPSAP